MFIKNEKASGIEFPRQRKIEIYTTESYGKFIFMSKDFEKKMEEASDEDLNVLSSMLDKQINEIQLKIALDCIEQKGMMPEFDQFLITNRYLNLWEALEKFTDLHSEDSDKDNQSSRKHFSSD